MVDISVNRLLFSNTFKFLQLHPPSANSILKKAYPGANDTSFSDILAECTYCRQLWMMMAMVNDEWWWMVMNDGDEWWMMMNGHDDDEWWMIIHFTIILRSRSCFPDETRRAVLQYLYHSGLAEGSFSTVYFHCEIHHQSFLPRHVKQQIQAIIIIIIIFIFVDNGNYI